VFVPPDVADSSSERLEALRGWHWTVVPR
jgi:hypothetical protein